MKLVGFLGKDKNNWGQVQALINRMDAEKIVLVKDKNSDNFPISKENSLIEYDAGIPLLDLKKYLYEKLKSELSGDFEVALSIASGTGKEHMAIIASLLSIPVGIKIIAFTSNGIEFLT